MNYRELLYKNALSIIENIYIESKYDPDVDLYRSFDVMNSVNESQTKSKEWLIEKLIPFIPEKHLYNICILGSWYGYTSLLLREQVDEKVHIHNVDSDPLAEHFSRQLLKGTPTENTYFVNEDAEDWIFDNIQKCDIIINTSCEHMEAEDIRLMIAMKKPNSVVCFQGNNYHSVQSHINTHDSLEDFAKSLDLTRVFYSGKFETADYDRYMVIGI
jgi:hypothetical protein